MNKKLEEFRSTFQVDELTLYKNDHWTWSVRPAQITLGAGILSLNTYCEAFSSAPSGAGESLQDAICVLEKTLKKSFSYKKINYLMLMMSDSHLHYHVIPRYDTVLSFNDLQWMDSGWPKFPVLADNQHSQKEVILSLKKYLLAEMA